MIKKARLKRKIGGNFAMPKSKELGKTEKKEIDKAVAKIVKEYGEALKLLSRESPG